MAKKKASYAEKLAKTPIEEISTWSEQRMRKELKAARYAVNRRLSAFKSRGMTSAAAIEYLGTGGLKPNVPSKKSRNERAESIRQKDPTKLSRNQMYLELARIQSFFSAKTSTVKGQAEVNREQDISIFGSDIHGNPKYTMTQKEREDYWAVYMEFYNQNTSLFSRVGKSETVKTILGDIQINGALDKNRLNDMLNLIKSELKEREKRKQRANTRERGRVANVHRGRRNGRGR